jgi:cardiolipin synthase
MSAEVSGNSRTWFCTGQGAFAAMLAAIDEAKESVYLETYIYSADALGERFRDALCRAGREAHA